MISVHKDSRLRDRLRGVRRQTETSAIVDTVAHLTITLVELFAAGELSDAALAHVNKHIASCSDCAEWVQVEAAQMAAIRSWPSKTKKIEKAAKKKTASG